DEPEAERRGMRNLKQLPWLFEARFAWPLQSSPHECPTVRAHPYAREEIHDAGTPQQHLKSYRTGDSESCRQRAERLRGGPSRTRRYAAGRGSSIPLSRKVHPAYVWRTQNDRKALCRGKQMGEVRVSPYVVGLLLIHRISAQRDAWRFSSDV